MCVIIKAHYHAHACAISRCRYRFRYRLLCLRARWHRWHDFPRRQGVRSCSHERLSHMWTDFSSQVCDGVEPPLVGTAHNQEGYDIVILSLFSFFLMLSMECALSGFTACALSGFTCRAIDGFTLCKTLFLFEFCF